MPKIKHIIVLLAGIVLFSHVSLCFGEQILILGNYNKPPKNYLEDNTPKGILVEIMQYVDDNIPQSFEYRLYPWKRAYQNALNGKGGIIGLSMNSERLNIFDYSDVMYYDELVLVVLNGHDFPFNNIQDLAGKRVGVLRGASYGEEFENGKNTIFTIAEDDGGQQRLSKLLRQRIDVAIIGPGRAGFNHIIQQNRELAKRKDEFVILSKPFYRDPNYLGFAKTMHMQEFLRTFNQVLQQGYKTGAIQKIIDEFNN